MNEFNETSEVYLLIVHREGGGTHPPVGRQVQSVVVKHDNTHYIIIFFVTLFRVWNGFNTLL